MKLVEALRLVNSPQQGAPFRVLLACGFTPLHLETALKAHLRLKFPERMVCVQTGLYDDLAGTLEKNQGTSDLVIVVLEWADLDPRLGWRSMAAIGEGVLADADARLKRISAALDTLTESTSVTLALPSLPLPPVFHTSGRQLHRVEANLRAMVLLMAASTRATVLHPNELRAPEHDLRAELMNGFPFSYATADALAFSLLSLAIPEPRMKGLITDLDETMWDGVLGDDGPEGVTWDMDRKTQFHALYQQLLNSFAEAGILIAVASKNDEALVQQVLRRSDLVVRPDRLFPVEANWRPKTESITRILKAWNIGEDAAVFVDDNALELEQVKTAFPRMDCVLFRRDDPSFLTELRNRFGKPSILQEDTLRIASLRGGEALRSAVTAGSSLDAVLQTAQAKIVFHCNKEPVDTRALELINKTNQFNLNGRKYTDADWRALIADPATRLMIVEYEDRFGKLGKIAVIAGQDQGAAFRVDSWVMSCRAFSRRIEHQCLKALLARWETITLAFTATERNGPLQDFLAELGIATCVERAHFEQRCPALFHETEFLDA